MDKRIEDYLSQIIKERISQIPDFYKDAMKRKRFDSQTPIEKLMYLSIVHVMSGSNFGWGMDIQKQVGKYRVDLMVGVRSKNGLMCIAVECDGHDFHEKTKEQAQKDKKRDRIIQRAGYHILRFSGSEIWRDPTSCAMEILDFFNSKVK